MDNNILLAIEPKLLPILTAFIAGLIVGFIYLRRCSLPTRTIVYHSSVMMASFFVALATIRYIQNGNEGFEHWLFIFIMYTVYSIGMIAGKRI